MEARRLADALAATVDAPRRNGRPSSPHLASRRGLWSRWAPEPDRRCRRRSVSPILSTRSSPAQRRDRSSGAAQRELQRLRPAYRDICFWPPGYGTVTGLTGLTEPDRVVAATTAASTRGGWRPSGARFGTSTGYRPVDTVVAIDTWASGRLDHAAFWRLASATVVSERDLVARWREEGGTNEENRDRLAALPPFEERLHLDDDEDARGWSCLPSSAHRWSGSRGSGRRRHCCGPRPSPCSSACPPGRTAPWISKTCWPGSAPWRTAPAWSGRSTSSRPCTGCVRPTRSASTTSPAASGPTRRSPIPAGRETWDATDLVQAWLAGGGLPVLVPFVEGRTLGDDDGLTGAVRAPGRAATGAGG